MSFPFLKLSGFDVKNAGLPTIDSGDQEGFLNLELAAAEHYLLGGNSDSLVSLQGAELTPLASSHSFSSGYMTITGDLEGLTMETNESTDQTFCAVVRVSNLATNKNVILGTAQTGPSAGSMLHTQADGKFNYFGYRASGSTAIEITPPSPNDKWWFVAAIESSVGSVLNATLYVGGVSSTAVVAATAKAVSSNKMAIGNGYFPDATYDDDIDIAEAILFSDVLTIAELDAVYERSKARLAARGITVE